ncbi:DNA-directed RNA polymerase subunit delta [Aerococcaceae bacterium WGS1372]
MELKQFEGQNVDELSLVEVAHAIIEETGDVYDFTDLLVRIQEYLNLSEEELESKMARFYTDMNIDGRFISLGDNRWGLRAWYPIDSIDEEIVSSIDDDDLPRRRRRKKKRKLNAFDEGEDMIDYNDDDPEDLDDIYEDEEEFEDEDEDDVEEVVEIAPDDEDEDDDNQELGVYARDLSELGDDDIDLDEDDEDFDEEVDEDFEDDDEFELEDEDEE